MWSVYQIVHIKNNTHTQIFLRYKNEGILYPSGDSQRRLLSSFYKNLKLDPRMVSYIEAHATGR